MESHATNSGLDPAAGIIHALGGPKRVAAITGTAVSAPYRWQHPRERGGTGGIIPQRHHRALLAFARARAIALSADDFLPPAGATEEATHDRERA
jgi:hypothetical protein